MKSLTKTVISLGILTVVMAGCVVAPAGYYHRGYYYHGPRVAVVAPAPVVVVRP
jgi:hypothetical protein